MQKLVTTQDAKEFLVGRIVRQAQIEGVPLSDVETRMLYFSESGWTLPDMVEVNAAFDREYVQAEYEEKMVALIRNALASARKEPEATASWTRAVESLRGEDHYISVLIDAARAQARPPGDYFKLVLTGLIIVAVFTAVALLWPR